MGVCSELFVSISLIMEDQNVIFNVLSYLNELNYITLLSPIGIHHVSRELVKDAKSRH